MESVEAFRPAAALISGLIAGAIVLILLIMALAVGPKRFPLNPLYLSGSAVSIDTTIAYVAGLLILMSVAAGYGIFVSAALNGFEVDSLEPLFGAGVGFVLSIVTGTTLAYARSLNRAVRAGYVGDPGPFLVRYGGLSVAQFVVAHVLFGVLAAGLYTVFR